MQVLHKILGSIDYPKISEKQAESQMVLNRFLLLKDFWKAIFPTATETSKIDFEDWVENAVQLRSAINHQKKLNVFVQNAKTNQISSITCDVEFDPSQSFMLTGSVEMFKQTITPNSAVVIPTIAEERAVDRYVHSKTFMSHCGRLINVGGFDDGEGDPLNDDENIVNIIQKMQSNGFHELIIKINERKYDIQPFGIPTNATSKQITSILYDVFEYTLVHLAGKKNAFIVQERVPMECEYRFIVVGGKVVSGAGCIEEFTPLNNNDCQFDNRVRKQRSYFGSQASEIIELPQSTLDKLIDFSKKVAMELNDEGISHYTLDVAINGNTGAPLVIELNPLRNFGLYANSFDRIFDAMVNEAYMLPIQQ